MLQALCRYLMSRIFVGSLIVQLLLIVCFLWFGWQADQAMDKTGIGNLGEWNRWNRIAGIAIFGMGIIWLATILLTVATRSIALIKAQIAIGFPPLALVLGWCASWLV